MIPSDHFVRFYNEVFKYLDDKPDGLAGYYHEIANVKNSPLVTKFRAGGIHAMCEYWSRIRHEENCELDIREYPDHAEFRMTKCPSLTKVMDNDAGPYERYCHHCPGWVLPVIGQSGYVCEFNIENRFRPYCSWKIYPPEAGHTSRALEEDNGQ